MVLRELATIAAGTCGAVLGGPVGCVLAAYMLFPEEFVKIVATIAAGACGALVGGHFGCVLAAGTTYMLLTEEFVRIMVFAMETITAGACGAMVGGPVGCVLAATFTAVMLFFEGNITLYHHTDEYSADSIASCGAIYQSESNGPRFGGRYGDGTYLTSIGPSASKADVTYNNYDGYRIHKMHKTEVAIEVRLPKSKAEKCKSDRDIYLYNGNLHLKDMKDVRFHVRNENGGFTSYTLEQFKNRIKESSCQIM